MMDKELFMKTRVLFTKSGCHYCRIWKEVIGRINSNLPVEKRIIEVDCTRYEYYGIIDNPLIRAYKKYLDGYPTLFFEGKKVEGANTKIELLAFLQAFLRNEFIEPVELTDNINGKEINLIFNKKCKYVKTLLGWRLRCE